MFSKNKEWSDSIKVNVWVSKAMLNSSEQLLQMIIIIPCIMEIAFANCLDWTVSSCLGKELLQEFTIWDENINLLLGDQWAHKLCLILRIKLEWWHTLICFELKVSYTKTDCFDHIFVLCFSVAQVVASSLLLILLEERGKLYWSW